ncbi:ATP-dependent metallopeptidase FtsH/Yme1/Tma family protein [bacterium]|nr:ATP-dependent metallopeptidase FtsH/Yme1/Tma family protein [bacterium]MBU1957213.1 ATP-dependent metallopeptidase FtsH/Yme1/Tma family protein [bacterium]
MWQSISKNVKIIILTFVVLVGILTFSSWEKSSKIIDKQEAMKLIESTTLVRVLIKEPYVYLHTKDNIYKVAKDALDKEKLFDKTLVEYDEESTETMDMILFIVLLSTMFYILYMMRSSRKAQEEFINNKQLEAQEEAASRQVIQAQHSTVNFSDVAGVEGVKEELEEIIDFLRYPAKYREFDIRLPKGVLLVGPPGVGKTLIAKAVAGEADVPFFYQSAASFVQIYVGMGAKRVSELFIKAKEMAPSIIFIDEIDAVGKSRGGHNNEEREATLNQLLTEMDGFEESSGVMVIAATNKIEVLDEALLRAGRFDRRVHIGLPNFEERASTLKLYLKDKKHSVTVDAIAKMTIGFNSAALATLINEAALYALRMGKKRIENSDIEAVKDKVLLGKHKIQTFNPQERKIQALYQAAKAVTASWLEVEYDKIGIISSSFIPHHNEILSKTILENELKVLLSGRIATHKIYNELFTNAKEDIKEAKVLTHKIIEEFAMTEEYFGSSGQIQTLLTEATGEVKSLLSKLEVVVDQVTVYLLENESITAEQTKKIMDELF